jgi:hypothetical protein
MPAHVDFRADPGRAWRAACASIVAVYRSLYLGGGGVVRGSRLVIRQSSVDTPTCSPARGKEGETLRRLLRRRVRLHRCFTREAKRLTQTLTRMASVPAICRGRDVTTSALERLESQDALMCPRIVAQARPSAVTALTESPARHSRRPLRRKSFRDCRGEWRWPLSACRRDWPTRRIE